MSWQDDAMIEQEEADDLFAMGEAEWKDIYNKSFRERFGKLTVEEALKLNEAARRSCEVDG